MDVLFGSFPAEAEHTSRMETIDLSKNFRPVYYDQYTNEKLPDEHVHEAIQDEIDYFNDHVCVGVVRFLCEIKEN